MIIEEELTANILFARREKEKKEALELIDKEYKPLFKELGSKQVNCYFSFDQLHLILSKILNGSSNREAYKAVKNEYGLSQEDIQKAYKNKSFAFESVLKLFAKDPTIKLLDKYKFFTKWHQKTYYDVHVSTGLSRLSRNIAIAHQLEKLALLEKENNALIKSNRSLKKKLQITNYDWFEDIALPMSKSGGSISDIEKATGQKKDTIRKRIIRYNSSQDNDGTCLD